MCFAACVCCSTWLGDSRKNSCFFTLPHTVNSGRSRCIRPSKVHLVSMKIFRPQKILTCQLRDASSSLLSPSWKLFSLWSQRSNPEICVVLMPFKRCHRRSLLRETVVGERLCDVRSGCERPMTGCLLLTGGPGVLCKLLCCCTLSLQLVSPDG